MSKKISEFVTVTGLIDTDWLTGLDNSAPIDQQNIKITKANLLTGLATDASVAQVASDLSAHEGTNAATAHPDGTTLTDLSNHKTGGNQHPIAGVTGLQTELDAKQDSADLGDAAFKDTGTLNTQVAAGDAPANAVATHDGLAGAHSGNIPTTAQKAALDGNPSLGGGNAVAGQNEIVDEGVALKSTGEAADRLLVTDGLNGFQYEDKSNLGHIIQEEDSPLAKRSNLNFKGAAVTASDNIPNDSTDVTVDAVQPSRAINPVAGETSGGGDLSADRSIGLADTTIAPGGSYSNPSITVDAKGRITAAANGPAGNAHVIQDEGVDRPNRTNLNFVGAGVTVTDDIPGDASVVTIPGGGAGSKHIIQEDTQNLADRTHLNFVGLLVTASDNVGNDATDVTVNPVEIREDNTPVEKRPVIDFIGAGVAIADNTTDEKTEITIDGVPVAHKTSHSSGQSDELLPSDIGAATTAQGALADSAVQPARRVDTDAGTGLTGGGDLSANRTIALANTTVTPGSYTNSDITVDAQGRLTAAASGSAGSLVRSRHVLGNQAANVNWNWASGGSGFTTTLTGNAVVGTPISPPALSAGQYREGVITMSQDATGGRVPTWAAVWKNAPTLADGEIAANAIVDMAFVYDGTDYVVGEPVTRT